MRDDRDPGSAACPQPTRGLTQMRYRLETAVLLDEPSQMLPGSPFDGLLTEPRAWTPPDDDEELDDEDADDDDDEDLDDDLDEEFDELDDDDMNDLDDIDLDDDDDFDDDDDEDEDDFEDDDDED